LGFRVTALGNKKNVLQYEGRISMIENNKVSEPVALEIGNLEYSIKMLRIKMQMTINLSEKIRNYREIKTLQETIDRLKIKANQETFGNTSPKRYDKPVVK